ncbi:hypothetical protein [Actinophytocola sp.]|uniref:hypothetical protein n=1 Tax=Actinophytocola sp. TaxID=1872138 RepID=UPI002ED05472
MAKRLLRREHIVAASLVGSVVVVVGFASGLGSRPGTGASAAPAPDGGGQPVATAPAPTTTKRPASGGSTRNPVGAVPVATATNRPPGTNHTVHPPATATTTPPTTGTTPPGTPCEPGLVPQALDTLLGTLDRATEALGLLGAAPVAGLTSVTAVPELLPDGTPLDQFVATCPAPTTSTAPTTTTATPPGHR